jgi:hypothetical protein
MEQLQATDCIPFVLEKEIFVLASRLEGLWAIKPPIQWVQGTFFPSVIGLDYVEHKMRRVSLPFTLHVTRMWFLTTGKTSSFTSIYVKWCFNLKSSLPPYA